MNGHSKRFAGILAAKPRRPCLKMLADRAGVATVELAVVLPVLMVIAMGMIDFSMDTGTRAGSTGPARGAVACACLGGASTTCRGDVDQASCAGGAPPGGFLIISATTAHHPVVANSERYFSDMSVQDVLAMRVD